MPQRNTQLQTAITRLDLAPITPIVSAVFACSLSERAYEYNAGRLEEPGGRGWYISTCAEERRFSMVLKKARVCLKGREKAC